MSELQLTSVKAVISDADSGSVCELLIICPSQETNQEVPGWLASLASRGGSYGSSSKRRGGGNRFGGRDFRNDRRGGGALTPYDLLY
jgi:hypothetical protein